MKRLAFPLVLLMFGAVPHMAAQTTYTQTQPSPCKLSDYVCQQIPITGGNYGIVDDTKQLLVGNEFYLGIAGVYSFGTITDVSEQPTFGIDGPFTFTWSLNSGQTGTVTGQLHFVKLGRWTLATIMSSKVTVN